MNTTSILKETNGTKGANKETYKRTSKTYRDQQNSARGRDSCQARWRCALNMLDSADPQEVGKFPVDAARCIVPLLLQDRFFFKGAFKELIP